MSGEFRESPLPHPGNAERLHRYWVHGEGAAKIGWGSPGDFERCVHQLEEHAHFTPEQADGYCNLAHHAATGMWPAQHAKASKGGRAMTTPTVSTTLSPTDAEMDMQLRELLSGMSEQEINDLADLGDACATEMGANT